MSNTTKFVQFKTGVSARQIETPIENGANGFLENLDKGSELLEAIQSLEQSKLLELITSLTPTDVDDKAIDYLFWAANLGLETIEALKSNIDGGVNSSSEKVELAFDLSSDMLKVWKPYAIELATSLEK